MAQGKIRVKIFGGRKMKIKSFYDAWEQREIDEYLKIFNVLVLFSKNNTYTCKIKIYGDMTESKKEQLENKIAGIFGAHDITDAVCDKINEFASKWYSKVILNKTYRIINKRGGK
jgi:hypothetical protein